MNRVLETVSLVQEFTAWGRRLEVLRGISLQLSRHQMVAITGRSGCGKSTLLLACGGMRQPTAGQVLIDGQDLFGLSVARRNRIRANSIGYLFQTLELIPYLSLLDNLRLVGRTSADQAQQMLAQLGLAERSRHKPMMLSQGERQRGALARALVHQPDLIIADEPTGNLDEESSALVFATLRTYCQNGGAVLVATHDRIGRESADLCYRLEQGQLSPIESADTISS